MPGVYSNLIPAGSIQTRQGVTNTSAASAPLNVQSVRISKAFSPANFQSGNSSVLTITLRNPTTSAYTGVNITDNLPAGLTISGTPVSPQCGGSITSTATSVTLSSGTIPAGTSYNAPGSCTISVTVASVTPASYTNTIPANTMVTDQGVTNVNSASANISVYTPGQGLTGSKSFTPSTIAVNGVSRLTISITAPADIALTGFSITDALPAGMQVAASPTPVKTTNCVGGTFTPVAGDTLLTYSGGAIGAGLNCQLLVNVTGTTSGVLTNTISQANISNDQNRNVTANFSANLTVAGMSVNKVFYPTEVNPDGISVLTIQLININDVQLDSVSFSDTLPGTSPNEIIVDATPAVTNTCGGSVTANPGSKTISLANGIVPAQVSGVPGTCTVNVEVMGKGAALLHTNIIPANNVSGTLHNTSIVIRNPTQAPADLRIGAVAIEVNKDFNPLTVFGGSASTLTVFLTNLSSVQLSGITFTDNLPQGTGGGMSIANPPDPSVGTCGGVLAAVPGATIFTFSGGSLPASGTCSLSVKVTMNVNGNLTNTIDIGAVTTSNGATNAEAAEATLTNTPGVSITKAFGPNPVQTVSGTSTLTFLIQNTGNFALHGLQYTDVLPAGLTVPVPPVEAQCGGSVTYDSGSNSITLIGGTLAGSSSCSILVDVSAAAPGNFENCIAIGDLSGLTPDNDVTTNNQATCDTLRVISPPAISKAFAPTSIAAGANSVLTFTLTNPAANTLALNGVAFTDTFPVGMTIASVPNPSQCGGLVSSTANSVSLSGGTLPVNSSCTVMVSVTASPGGSYENTSDAVTSTNGGTGNTTTATLTAIDPPTIAKQFLPNPIAVGGTSTLTFTLSNPNSTTLTGVSFSDTFPSGMSVKTPVVASTLNCGSPVFSPVGGATSLSFSGGTITSANPCTVNVDVVTSGGGTFVNTSSVPNSTNGGIGDDTATDTLTVVGAGLSLVKSTTNTAFYAVGSPITYNYLLTNSGSAPLYPPYTRNG